MKPIQVLFDEALLRRLDDDDEVRRVGRSAVLRHTVMVAPITSTIRGLPSEVVVGIPEGLKHTSAVNLDHVQAVEKARLVGFVGHLAPEKMRQVCRALAVAVGCDA